MSGTQTIGPPAAVAKQVIADGGTAEQAFIAAALVSGVETSAGDPINILSGGVGPAAGLFQFEPGTWIGAGGGAYSATAGGASWAQQIQVFVNATKGNNFHDWGPDLTGTGNPNSTSNPAYSYSGGPQAGSPVGNLLADVNWVTPVAAAIGSNVPLNWISGNGAGAVTPANPVPGPAGDVLGLATGGTVSDNIIAGAKDPLAALGSIAGALDSTAFWKRLGIGLLGVVFIGGGIILFVSTTKTGQRVESDAATAAVAA